MTRPPCIVSPDDVPEEQGSYDGSDEVLSSGRRIGRAAGLRALGVWLERLPPGTRTSWPHAHAREEELVFVLDGAPSVWLDGVVHPLRRHDLVAFPAGTGVAHTVINDGPREALLLVAGEARKDDDRIAYPLHPHREAAIGARAWTDAPRAPLGPHDGTPVRRAPSVVDPAVVVRDAIADDADAVKVLRLRGLREEGPAFGSTSAEEEHDDVRAKLAGQSPSQRVLLAVVDGAIAGMIGVARDGKAKGAHKAQIWGMYVAPEARGRGAASRLVDAAIDAARAMAGVTHLRLAVVVDAVAARRLYAAKGFVPWGREPAAFLVDGRHHDLEWLGRTI